MHRLYSTALNVILGLNHNKIKCSDHKSFGPPGNHHYIVLGFIHATNLFFFFFKEWHFFRVLLRIGNYIS